MFADQALARFVRHADVVRVIDIGSGNGQHAQVMRDHGKQVATISKSAPAMFVGDYMQVPCPDPLADGIWASHVLEHMPNVQGFLEKCFRELRDDGLLAVTVPPAKHQIVGGHVSLWNEGLLLYRLILAGFDCAQARVGVYGYNISVLVRKKRAVLPELAMDCGDIERLAKFFPVPVTQGFDGQLGCIEWGALP